MWCRKNQIHKNITLKIRKDKFLEVEGNRKFPEQPKSKILEVIKMEKYRCIACGYVYDPEEGDPISGIEPGTAFEDLPQDWICPMCGVGKDQFEVVE